MMKRRERRRAGEKARNQHRDEANLNRVIEEFNDRINNKYHSFKVFILLMHPLSISSFHKVSLRLHLLCKTTDGYLRSIHTVHLLLLLLRHRHRHHLHGKDSMDSPRLRRLLPLGGHPQHTITRDRC
jgi:hypothetical protein